MHRPRSGVRDERAHAIEPERRGHGVAGEAGSGIRFASRTLGRRDVAFEPHRAREDSGLHGRLVRADAAQLGRPVGREHDERHARVVRLEHGGVQVRDGGARRRHDDRRMPRLDREAQREESRTALVDAHVQAKESGAFELGRGEREGLRPRARGDDDVAHAGAHELVEQRDCEGGRGAGSRVGGRRGRFRRGCT